MENDIARLNALHFDGKDAEEFLEASPHLNHENLRNYCFELAERALRETGVPPESVRVLDLGAGEGVMTHFYLERGCRVTAVDVSTELLARLVEGAKAHGDRLEVVEGDVFEVLEEAARGEPYQIVSACSFLHHIVDYVALCKVIAKCLGEDGVFYAFQDPMRYATLPAGLHRRQQLAYFQWRIFQGGYVRGLKTRARRLCGIYRDDLPEDNAEYHVVRDGVDEEAIRNCFEGEGMRCEILTYWSTHSRSWQRRGERKGWKNQFAVMAKRGEMIAGD